VVSRKTRHSIGACRSVGIGVQTIGNRNQPSTQTTAPSILLGRADIADNPEGMRYPEYRRQHLFVGSGVIEAGCKTVIGSRLKQSGMFWTVRGANAIIALRCSYLNGRFEDSHFCVAHPNSDDMRSARDPFIKTVWTVCFVTEAMRDPVRYRGLSGSSFDEKMLLLGFVRPSAEGQYIAVVSFRRSPK